MLQTAVRVVESPSPLLVTVSLFSAGQDRKDIERTRALPLNVKSQSSKSLPSAYGSDFPTRMSSGRSFDTDCPIVLDVASVSPVTAASIAVFGDY